MGARVCTFSSGLFTLKPMLISLWRIYKVFSLASKAVVFSSFSNYLSLCLTVNTHSFFFSLSSTIAYFYFGISFYFLYDYSLVLLSQGLSLYFGLSLNFLGRPVVLVALWPQPLECWVTAGATTPTCYILCNIVL